MKLDERNIEDWIRNHPNAFKGKTPDEIGNLAIAAGYSRDAVSEFVSQLARRPLTQGETR